MIVEIYYDEIHMADIKADTNDVNSALEWAFRRTQNIEGSWSQGMYFDDGEKNLDYHPDVIVMEEIETINGKKYGHRSSMMGDIFVIDGKRYEVDFIGFKEAE